MRGNWCKAVMLGIANCYGSGNKRSTQGVVKLPRLKQRTVQSTLAISNVANYALLFDSI